MIFSTIRFFYGTKTCHIKRLSYYPVSYHPGSRELQVIHPVQFDYPLHEQFSHGRGGVSETRLFLLRIKRDNFGRRRPQGISLQVWKI